NRTCWKQGGYFFFVILITSAIIETTSVPKRNSSSYVTIWHHPLTLRGRKVCPLKRGTTAYRCDSP
ncbi:MAG: hypothetical protein MJ076_00410, partial [Clostridia bacterium]|nr:hypothetical protein [Clostridia bacterium]